MSDLSKDMKKTYIVDGVEIEVDEELKATLNNLARKFYSVMGYQVKEGFDFISSQHPQELQMFSLALHAYKFNLEVGL